MAISMKSQMIYIDIVKCLKDIDGCYTEISNLRCDIPVIWEVHKQIESSSKMVLT